MKIAIGVDGSTETQKAVAFVKNIMKASDEVVLINVLPCKIIPCRLLSHSNWLLEWELQQAQAAHQTSNDLLQSLQTQFGNKATIIQVEMIKIGLGRHQNNATKGRRKRKPRFGCFGLQRPAIMGSTFVEDNVPVCQ
jgi:hypothetical protein